MNKKQLAKRIEDLMLEKDMTVRQVAVFLGVSTGTVTRLMRGENCFKRTHAKIERQLDKAQVAA
jgi:transcriptional regulator with XRE-family HTH domain